MGSFISEVSLTINESQIRETVKKFLVTNFFLDTSVITLNPDTSFLENGIIDSTGILEVIQFLQETYEIKVEDKEMLPENLDSIGNISMYVARKTS